MSQAKPMGRETPRWSVAGQPTLLAALIAALLTEGARVSVGPPLF
jgi:hypothetical protein